MGILDGAIDRAKKFNDGLRESQTTKLIKDTEATEREFAAEAKKIGLDTDKIKDGVIGAETADSIYDLLLAAYNTSRNRDFDEYNLKTAVPLDPDSLKAATEVVIGWNKKYRETVNKTFGRFWDYGKELKKLEKANGGLIEHETEESSKVRLKENLERIEAMIRIFGAADKVIREVIGEAEYNLTITENNLADDLRKSITESTAD